MPLHVSPPGADEYADFHAGYMAAMAGEDDAMATLHRQWRELERLRALDATLADGKWSVRELVGHLSDTERVLAYRLLRLARGDQTPLPGFDEQLYAANSGADHRTIADLVDELTALRASTIALVRALDEGALDRRGVVNDWRLSARALVYIIAGHFQHHVNVLRTRYGVAL
jgi:hypothetical protein